MSEKVSSMAVSLQEVINHHGEDEEDAKEHILALLEAAEEK